MRLDPVVMAFDTSRPFSENLFQFQPNVVIVTCGSSNVMEGDVR